MIGMYMRVGCFLGGLRAPLALVLVFSNVDRVRPPTWRIIL